MKKMTIFAVKTQKNDWVLTPNIFVSALCEGRADTKENKNTSTKEITKIGPKHEHSKPVSTARHDAFEK